MCGGKKGKKQKEGEEKVCVASGEDGEGREVVREGEREKIDSVG